MHSNNHKWFMDIKDEYPENFSGVNVLEIGSHVYSGESVRKYFENCTYHGIDYVGGENVDDVIEGAIDLPENTYETIVCLSVFEHDMDWRSTLEVAVRSLRPGGLMFVCFGAEDNEPHMVEEMGWAIVPHQAFIKFCATLPVNVLDSFFEEYRYGKDCRGAYNVILKKLP